MTKEAPSTAFVLRLISGAAPLYVRGKEGLDEED